jgi:hypothetical protein
MMTMANQRARGLGHRAFYLHPEGQPGTGGLPGGSSETGDDDSLVEAPRPTGTEPQGETGASTTTK